MAAGQAKAAEIAARMGLSVTPAPQAPPPAPAAVSVGAGAGGAAFKPAPLRLDAQGREVDEFGNLVARPAQVGWQGGPRGPDRCAGLAQLISGMRGVV